MKISDKVPSEIIPVSFEYSNIVSAVDSVVSVSITVMTGTDPDVADMLYGAYTLTGTRVVQLVRNGVAGTVYRLSCLVSVGSEKYEIDGDMAVKAWHST